MSRACGLYLHANALNIFYSVIASSVWFGRVISDPFKYELFRTEQIYSVLRARQEILERPQNVVWATDCHSSLCCVLQVPHTAVCLARVTSPIPRNLLLLWVVVRPCLSVLTAPAPALPCLSLMSVIGTRPPYLLEVARSPPTLIFAMEELAPLATCNQCVFSHLYPVLWCLIIV